MLQNPKQVLTSTARERLTRVLDSDDITTIVGPDEVGPGTGDGRGRSAHWHFVADTVNDFAWATAKKFVWAATRATIPGKGRVPIHMYYLPGNANLVRERRADLAPRARVLLEALVPVPVPAAHAAGRAELRAWSTRW